MKKSKTDNLLDSIGGVSDRWVAELMEEPAAKASPNVRPIVKKLAVSLVAAAMCMALAITCFANADLIKSIFQREQELIDPYAIKVDESVAVENVTLTVDKVVWGGGYYVYYTFKNSNGIFDKGLTFDRLAIKEGDDFANRDTVGVIGGPEERGTDPGSSIAIAGYGLENPSDTISAMFRTDLLGGTYTLAFENVTSYDGSVKYADEIEFEVKLPGFSEIYGEPDEQNIMPEPVGAINTVWKNVGKMFTIEGENLVLERIGFSPYEVSLIISDPGIKSVNYLGYDYYYASYIGGFMANNTKEIVDGYIQCSIYPEYDDNEVAARSQEIYEELEPHIAELEALTYKAYARLADGCTAQIVSRYQGQSEGCLLDDDGKLIRTEIKASIDLEFSIPVYEEEILEIYLERESDGARVTVYEKPE